MKIKISLLALTLVALTLAGCNTVDGIGEDIEGTGEAMQDSSY